jgi:hypothetical protein
MRNDLKQSFRLQPMASLPERCPPDLIPIRDHALFEEFARFEIALNDIFAHHLVDLFGKLFGGSTFNNSWHIESLTNAVWGFLETTMTRSFRFLG